MGNLRTTVIVFTLLTGLFASNLHGQRLSLSLEPDSISIGGHTQLSFEVEAPREAIVLWPPVEDELNPKIEVLRYGLPDTLAAHTIPENVRIIRTFKITSWEDGFHAINPFEFTMIFEGDTLVKETEPLLLEVEPFLLDEQADLKDIKSIYSLPVTFREIVPYVLIVIVAGILIWLLLRYLKKRKPKPIPQSVWEKPDIPAHVAAISSLEKLKSEKLWQQGKIKHYHSELAGILRRYLDKRFEVNAMEMTTSEILQSLKYQNPEGEVSALLQQIFELADLVKFAKTEPGPEDNEKVLDMAFDFVRNTREQQEEKSNG